jgi:hypothetical protein
MLKWKCSLPIIAVVALVVAIAGLFLVGGTLNGPRVESGETQQSVDAAVAKLQSSHPDSLEAPAFREAVEKLRHARFVVYVWLIRPDGQIAYSTAPSASHGRLEGVGESATKETRRILSEMPEGFLTSQQKTALLAASAIQSEGEHNDVYRHMIRPIQNGNDMNVGFIGVAYATSPGEDAFPGVPYAITLLLIPIGLLVYWLALPGWVFLDAKGRGEKAWVWAMFVLLGNLVALFAYLLTRHPRLLGRTETLN